VTFIFKKIKMIPLEVILFEAFLGTKCRHFSQPGFELWFAKLWELAPSTRPNPGWSLCDIFLRQISPMKFFWNRFWNISQNHLLSVKIHRNAYSPIFWEILSLRIHSTSNNTIHANWINLINHEQLYSFSRMLKNGITTF
jgi:hypothetical protein